MMPALSEEPFIHQATLIQNSRLGRWTEIGEATRLRGVDFDDYAYCDRFCDIAHARIGKFANIASFVRIGATDHPLDRASLHHFMYRASYYWPEEPDEATIFVARAERVSHIGRDTWLGHASIIKPGITIGDGAVVGSGAMVTKDVAPYTIVAGNPAKPIRMRQPPDIAERLIALGWWDWDHDRLQSALPDFRSLSAEAFLERYGG